MVFTQLVFFSHFLCSFLTKFKMFRVLFLLYFCLNFAGFLSNLNKKLCLFLTKFKVFTLVIFHGLHTAILKGLHTSYFSHFLCSFLTTFKVFPALFLLYFCLNFAGFLSNLNKKLCLFLTKVKVFTLVIFS